MIPLSTRSRAPSPTRPPEPADHPSNRAEAARPGPVPRAWSNVVEVADNDEFDAFAGDRSFVMSFARGVSVIQAFSNTSRPLTISEISHRVHIPRAAVRRLLHTLSELGYVRSEGLRYALTPKILQLGHAFSSSNEFSIGVQPIVQRLSERLQCFVALLVPEGDETMLVCTAGRSAAPVRFGGLKSAPGARAPLYASASGVMFLSAMSDAQRDAYFKRVALRPLTFRTPTVPAQILDSIARARQQGFADCDRTYSNDLRAVAVPVHDRRGTVVAALAAVGLPERFTDHHVHDALLPELLTASVESVRFWA